MPPVPSAIPCPSCGSERTMCPRFPGDWCDCADCGHSWPFLTDERLEVFVQHYIIAALWASTDDDGNPLDAEYRPDDFTSHALSEIREDCRLFLIRHSALVSELEAVAPSYGYGNHPDNGTEWPVLAACAHDYFLTRNGHGSGFWDCGLGELGTALTNAAHSMGEQTLYVGDDSHIHIA